MHTINDTKVMSTRYIAFFCLILQLLWVFFSAYLPSSLAYADDGKNVASSSHSLFSSNTVLYTLGEGESVSSVAKKFDLTINELKMLNQFRTYSKPFDNLSRGDVVDIPSKNLADKGYLYEDNQNKEEDYIVNSMSTVGGMLSSGDVGRQSKSLAKGFAVGEVNHRLSDFLGRFGTAKVQLNMDDKLNFDGSSADVLVPIWDKDKYLAFSQWGIRYKDERTTWNLGFGLRYFKDSWMFGVNSFYDYDLTGENRRWGIGAEAWTDYLKLSTNGYFRINDWHQSRDLEDFDERPADGFDIQAEAYIPSYSQLGGKLGFEHYRGQNVALFGSNHLQKNPSAVTIGVNYTPIPLVTIAVEHKNGQGGEHDTQLKLDATLQLGVPLYQQLDSSNVSNLRTLEGSRYDLVNRNNDIILDYRKQELISLELTPKSLSGEGSETGTIVANVKAKYGVERIDWNAAELIAAGGSIQEISKQTLRVVYPKYDVNAKNNYDVNAVAYDSHGNSSNADISHISVSEPSIIEPTISVIKDDAIANGIDSNIVQVKVTDSNGNALSDKQVVFKSDASVEIESPTVTTDAQGLGQTSLRSTDAESFKVLASVDGINTETVVTFTANASAATVSSLSSDVPAQVADGSSAITFTAVLKDSNGNLVAEAPVAFSTTGGALAQPSVTTNAQGEARVTLTSTQVGEVTVTAKAQENAADGGKSQAVTFTANASAATVSSLSSDVPAQVADGSSAITFTAVLKDSNGNLVAKAPVAFSTTGGALAQPSATTNAQGEARVTLTSTQVGEVTVTAKAQENAADGGKSQAVTFTANASAATVSSLSSDVPAQVADGSSAITFTAVLKDSNGNLVAKAPVAFSTTGGALAQPSATTNAQGEARVTLTSTQVGEVTVTAKAQENAADGGKSQAVTFTANASAATVSSLSSDVPAQVADGSSAITFTAVLKDSNGNLVAEAPVAFSTTGGALAQPSVTTNAQGEARVTLTSTQVGEVTVTAKAQENAADGGKSQAVTFIAVLKIRSLQRLNKESQSEGFSPNEGFPTTAVKDGKTYFAIKLEGGQEQSKKWSSSDSSVATVDSSGHVMLAGSKGNATITISDDISEINYSFTIKKVFTLLKGPAVSQLDAKIQCSNIGLSLPLVEDITNAGTTSPYKAVGNLWGEWGDFPALWSLSGSQYIYTGTADSKKYTMVNGAGMQTSFSYSVSHTSQFSCI